MVDLEWDPNYVPMVKLVLHGLQILISFVVWCLEIAVFMGKGSHITGDNGWTFGVCFLSIPAWIFLVMTPRFGRTRRFAQPHAMLAVDAVFTVVWLSAFATQAAFNGTGKCGDKCSESKAIVGLGVLNTLLFAATTFVSVITLRYYQSAGNLPGYDNRKIRGGGDNIDPDKAAFSMAPHDEEAYERVHMDDHEASGSGGYDHANPYSADDYDDPSRYGARPTRMDNTMFDSETEYNPGGHSGMTPPPLNSGMGGSPYDEPARFPAGDYDRVQR